MRKYKKHLLLIVCFILLFRSSASYATQNNARTEDKQIVTIELIDKKTNKTGSGRLPQTGESRTYMTLAGFVIVLLALLFYRMKKERSPDE